MLNTAVEFGESYRSFVGKQLQTDFFPVIIKNTRGRQSIVLIIIINRTRPSVVENVTNSRRQNTSIVARVGRKFIVSLADEPLPEVRLV